MANLIQLKTLESLDGFLLVDKPVGISFAAVVKAVKRKYGLVKVGHGGSLDAMASGLFILLLGDANKFVDRVMGADRTYEGTIRYGLKTDTGDIHGHQLATSAKPTEAELAEKLPSSLREFRGDVFQTEPRFCSIRKDGTAEYEIAETGEHQQFLAHVYRFEVNGGSFALSATKGLIPRALISDFGDVLGCGAALESLRRISIGKFTVADAIPFDRLLDTEAKDFASCVMPLSKALL